MLTVFIIIIISRSFQSHNLALFDSLPSNTLTLHLQLFGNFVPHSFGNFDPHSFGNFEPHSYTLTLHLQPFGNFVPQFLGTLNLIITC